MAGDKNKRKLEALEGLVKLNATMNKRKKSKGAPYEFTERDLDMAAYMHLAGHNFESIAAYFRISKSTFRKYFRDYLNERRVEIDALVSNSLLTLIKKGSVPATIFYLKCRLGWREEQQVDKAQKVKVDVMLGEPPKAIKEWTVEDVLPVQ